MPAAWCSCLLHHTIKKKKKKKTQREPVDVGQPSWAATVSLLITWPQTRLHSLPLSKPHAKFSYGQPHPRGDSRHLVSSWIWTDTHFPSLFPLPGMFSILLLNNSYLSIIKAPLKCLSIPQESPVIPGPTSPAPPCAPGTLSTSLLHPYQSIGCSWVRLDLYHLCDPGDYILLNTSSVHLHTNPWSKMLLLSPFYSWGN